MMSKLVPGSSEWNEIQDTDLPNTEFTDETKKVSQEWSARFRGSVRLSMSMFDTDEEHEKWRREVLETPLP